MDLEEQRKKIDAIDDQLIALLEQRMRTAEEIARIKQAEGLAVTDPLRERRLLDRIMEKSSADMAGYNRILWNSILEMSKDHQRKTQQEEAPVVKEIRKALTETPPLFPESATVACQGTEGAYSQEACDKFFKMPHILYTKNFRGVFAAIQAGLCKYGVLPLENSTAGSVNQIYDLMMEYDFHIVKSVRLKISHSLLALPGVRKEEIREIYSHPQALAQCEKYLKEFPNAVLIPAVNTAVAARQVAESGRRDVAAIGSEKNGSLYGLETLERNIQDQDNNYTRFILITRDLEIYPGANKTSLMMILEHRPGSLYNVLARFNALGINLEKLESRPLPSREFEFMFYFDIRESVYSDGFMRMMNQLTEMALEFRYLGSYTEE